MPPVSPQWRYGRAYRWVYACPCPLRAARAALCAATARRRAQTKRGASARKWLVPSAPLPPAPRWRGRASSHANGVPYRAPSPRPAVIPRRATTRAERSCWRGAHLYTSPKLGCAPSPVCGAAERLQVARGARKLPPRDPLRALSGEGARRCARVLLQREAIWAFFLSPELARSRHSRARLRAACAHPRWIKRARAPVYALLFERRREPSRRAPFGGVQRREGRGADGFPRALGSGAAPAAAGARAPAGGRVGACDRRHASASSAAAAGSRGGRRASRGAAGARGGGEACRLVDGWRGRAGAWAHRCSRDAGSARWSRASTHLGRRQEKAEGAARRAGWSKDKLLPATRARRPWQPGTYFRASLGPITPSLGHDAICMRPNRTTTLNGVQGPG